MSRPRTNLLRILAAASFAAGVALLIIAFAGTGGDDDDENAADFPDLVATPTPTPTPTPTAAITEPTPTPSPTPTPYDGTIARLQIPALEVDSAVEEIGLLPTNQLDVPKDPHKTGWYTPYDKPGVPNPLNTGWTDFNVYAEPGWKGNAVFSAHKDYFPDVIGPFNKLRNLALGDEIVVEMDNGLQYRYRVIKNQNYDASNFPTGDLIWPKDKPADVEWITLITCDGTFVQTDSSGSGEYLDRRVVVAELISP